MRIDLNMGIAQAAEAGRASHPGSGVEPGKAGGALAPDTAKLSVGRASVAALAAAANQLPEIRQEKVSALSQLLRSGAYQVTSEQTAEALLAHMSASSAA